MERTLKLYKIPELRPTDEILWKWFQGNFALWSINNFKKLALSTQKELRAYLRCGGVFIQLEGKILIDQTLYKVANEKI